MLSKEEYYQSVLENRRIAADPENTKCVCPAKQCVWHGKCTECVAVHRYHGDHIPACLQPIVREKVKALAHTVEFAVSPSKEYKPADYYEYVAEQDRMLAEGLREEKLTANP